MHASIEPFVPAHASEQDLRGYYDVTTAIGLEVSPTTPQPTFKEVVEVLRAPDRASVRRRFWIARCDGAVVGLVIAYQPLTENTDAVMAETRVLPEARRQGAGAALLEAMLSDSTFTAGRTRVVGFDVAVGGDGEDWAAGLGFKRTLERVIQALPVPQIDPQRWHVPVPDGFALEAWLGSAPENLVVEYARARTAIADAPVGESSVQQPEWTVQRVREREAFERQAGRDQWVVAAKEVASGRIVGMTEMAGYPKQDTVAFQQDTAVLAEFRGNGLGRAMKAAMMRNLLAARPRLQRVETTTAADNSYMIKVNHDLGYVTTRRVATFEATITDIRSHLAARVL